jgi:hypothetical protein
MLIVDSQVHIWGGTRRRGRGRLAVRSARRSRIR